MRSVLSFLLSISGLLTIPTSALANKMLRLGPALVIAAQNNTPFKAAPTQPRIRETEMLTAKAFLKPSFVSDNKIAEKIYWFELEQTFEFGHKRQKQAALAQAQRDVAPAELNTQLLEFRSEGKRTYTQASKAQERQPNYANTLQELIGIARKREKANGTSQTGVIKGLQAATQIELANCQFQGSTCILIVSKTLNKGVFS